MFKKLSLFIMTLVLSGLVVATPTYAETAIQPRTLEPRAETETTEIIPTFTTEVTETTETAAFRFGDNAVIFDNNLVSEEGGTGLLFAFGNIMTMKTESEYGFLFGNSIDYNGKTNKDLFVFGNQITLGPDAEINGDVFSAAASLIVETDLIGDLSATAGEITLRNINIAGNLNLNVDKVTFEDDVTIGGELVYNDTAEVVGLDKVTATEINPFEGASTDERALIGSKIINQIFGILSMFLAMFCLLFLGRNIATKVNSVEDVAGVGRQLAYGLVVLFLVPLVILFGLMSFIASPVALILLALYIIAIYISQGFSGLWLGHLIIVKLFKGKGNQYIEALLGITLLGFCSLIPVIGGLTNFLSIIFGLGLIISQFKTVSLKPRATKKAVITEKVDKK